MPAIRRTLKNVVKNYSDAQVKVREATSNDPWGPSSTLMSEIADLTYNVVAFTEIMQMVWKRLNDDGKNWRHVYKSLVVLDYIIKTGSEKVGQQCKENFHAIKTLTSFQYVDQDNKDQGINVREKAKQLVAMLSDDERLKNERAKALKAKERFAQNAMGVGNGGSSRMRLGGSPTSGGGGYVDSYGYPDSSPGSGSAGTPSEMESARPSSAGEEELQLQLALAMSKEEHDEHMRKQQSDDIKLQMAIEQSKEQAKNERKRQQYQHLSGPSQSSQNSTLLDLAGVPSSGAQAADPWGLPMPQPEPPSRDPWGAPLPTSQPSADPWGGSGGAAGGAGAPPPYPTSQASSSSAPDPWGLPGATPTQNAGKTSSGWTSPSGAPQGSAWGGSSSQSGVDAFGAPIGPITNGTSGSGNIDNEFDLLSSRSNEASPTKSQGLEEFDLLAGGSTANSSSTDAFNMDGLNNALPGNKKKKAEDFLGANANLVNLDQLVSKAPPKGNNPFAMTTGANNPFGDPHATVRVPMAQLQGVTANQGFTQAVSGDILLPAPLVPSGTSGLTNSGNPFL